MERKEFRFSIPAADQASIDWLAAQDHRGVSLRMLIRQHLAQYGPVDVLSTPIGDSIPVNPDSGKKKKKPASAATPVTEPKKQNQDAVNSKANKAKVEPVILEDEDDEPAFTLPPRPGVPSATAGTSALSSDALFGYADQG